MSRNADISIMIVNNSTSPIYANGGKGTWDEVDWGPEWSMTEVPAKGQLPNGWSAPLSWNNFTNAGSAHGSAGYAISSTTTPTQNIVNFTFVYKGGGSSCASGISAENAFQSNTITCLKLDYGTGNPNSVSATVDTSQSIPRFTITYNG